MMNKSLEILMVLVFVILAGILWSSNSKATNEIPESISEELARISEVKDLNQGPRIYKSFEAFEPLLRQNNDTTYVINFWATWCKPCVAELPIFEALNSKARGSKVKVILCSLDFPNSVETSLLPFIDKNDLRSEIVVLLDGKFNRWVDKVSTDWSGAIPATYIYKNEKKIFVEKSFDDISELEELIEKVK